MDLSLLCNVALVPWLDQIKCSIFLFWLFKCTVIISLYTLQIRPNVQHSCFDYLNAQQLYHSTHCKFDQMFNILVLIIWMHCNYITLHTANSTKCSTFLFWLFKCTAIISLYTLQIRPNVQHSCFDYLNAQQSYHSTHCKFDQMFNILVLIIWMHCNYITLHTANSTKSI